MLIGLAFPPYWKAKYLKNIQNLSKPAYGLKEERDVYVPMRHGAKLTTDII